MFLDFAGFYSTISSTLKYVKLYHTITKYTIPSNIIILEIVLQRWNCAFVDDIINFTNKNIIGNTTATPK